jgi:hydroxyacyl-ACP dehydratase HTD2-like protein with hotdog domain
MNVEVSMDIPELVVTPDHTQVFMFSAVTWNRHHIHYDKDAAIAEGFPDVVVQRGLIGNFLARLLTTWLGKHGEIRALSWKVTRSAFPGTTLRCRGRVVAVEPGETGRTVSCELAVLDGDNQTVASGNARVAIYR